VTDIGKVRVKKVKVAIEQSTKAQGAERYRSTVSLTSVLDGVGGQHHTAAALLPGKTRYPSYWRLGGTQGRSGQVWKISPPPGFDPQTAQSVARRYTDGTILAPD
jgi:hypothetical protein